MSQRVVLVTGSTDGIGRQTARQLAAGGMKVIVHGRSKAKVDAAVAALRDELPGADFEAVSFDLGTVAGVRRGVEHLLKLAPKLHVLVNNAGIFAAERAMTEDGVEATFAVNYLGAFALTELLMPRLIESAAGGPPSRVICVASVAHTRGRIHFDDLSLSSAWTSYAAYAQSKLANVMHAITLGERLDPKQVVAYSLHPGVVNTKLLRQGFGPVQGLAPDAGAKTSVMLAGAESVDHPTGSYFSDGVAAQPASTARDVPTRGQLWDVSVNLAKLS
ncbi:MAG: oxidoreductase, short chain dehydrogenase/reductase family [Myxococcales bacterium]|nr:oxidoreductase, short chain dehydrogenase/reductase family [Myxococcales bacterium]